MIGFTVIPLLLIVYYGLTDQERGLYSGKCPFHRNPGAPESTVFIPGTVPGQHCHLPALGLSAGHDPAQPRHRARKLHGFHLHPSDVDELSAAHPGVADPSGEKWRHQWHSFLSPSAKHRHHQHTGAIILGMVYNFLPFMILPIYNVLAKIDDNTINAAKDLGANNFQTLIHIWIPLSIPGIISGITMVFVPALTTFVISSLLGGSKILLIGNVIEQEFTKGSNWHLGSGLSLVLMIFILLSMALIAKYDKEGEGNAF